jgi:hypothetical protein
MKHFFYSLIFLLVTTCQPAFAGFGNMVIPGASGPVGPAGGVDSVNGRAGHVTGVAEDSGIVHLTGTETIPGFKNFSGSGIKTHDIIARGPYVDVRYFGALLTGAVNDTAAIQAAIDSGVKRVYVPRGTPAVCGLNLRSGVELFGDGRINTVFRPYTSCNDYVIKAFNNYSTNDTTNSIVRGHVHDIGIDLRNSLTSLGGILLKWAYAWTFDRVYVHGTGNPAAIGFNVDNAFNVLFTSSQANMGAPGALKGIGWRVSSSSPDGQNVTQIKWDDCLAQYNTTGLQFSGATSMDGLTIQNMGIGKNTTGVDFLTGTYFNTRIAENHIEYNGTGIKAVATFRGASIINNFFWDDDIAIDFTSAQNVDLDLNIFHGSAGSRTTLKAVNGDSIRWGANVTYATAYSGTNLTGINLNYVPTSDEEVIVNNNFTNLPLQKARNKYVLQNTNPTSIGLITGLQTGQTVIIRFNDSKSRFYESATSKLKEGGVYGSGTVLGLYTPDGTTVYEMYRKIPRESVAPSAATSIFYTFPHNVGDIRFNSAPIAGGNVGWICTTAGFNVKGAWTTGTAYVIGDHTSNGGKLYEATSAGTSGATAPTHASGTVSDGTVNWLWISNSTTASVWKTYGGVAP